MYRNIIEDLVAWQEGTGRQMLYIKGAKGVGKTWTVRDFATAFFPAQCYIDVSEGFTPDAESLDALLASRFTEQELTTGLIIFDEVQTVPRIAEFFYEYAKLHREYRICLIASTMLITEFEYSHSDCFKLLRMRPMSFEEFLIANKAHSFIDAIRKHKDKVPTNLESGAILSLLRDYLLVGGMPGVVSAYVKTKDLTKIRPLQEELIASYTDLMKQQFPHAMYQRTKRVWSSIPKQLSKDNKKFMYKLVEDNARSREYAEATQNLCDLGLARKMPRVKGSTIPLENHVDYKSFELFFLDHGLLRAIAGLPLNDSVRLEDILTESGGAIAEQYLFEELSSSIGVLYYWISGATARVPFVYEGKDSAVPVDIRLVPNHKAQNIKVFKEKNPETHMSLRITLDKLSLEEEVMSIPIYGLWNI